MVRSYSGRSAGTRGGPLKDGREVAEEFGFEAAGIEAEGLAASGARGEVVHVQIEGLKRGPDTIFALFFEPYSCGFRGRSIRRACARHAWG